MKDKRILRALEEYNNKYMNKKQGTKAAFYVSDINDIIEANQEKYKNDYNYIIYSSVADALQAGFIIGHRAAKREIRLANKKKLAK
ncbi:MAG: hypothetical protein WAO49_01795 [Arcanobacterium sp.]